MPMVTEMSKLPDFDYESFLAEAMRDYLDYLDHLGFSTVMQFYNLKCIDRFLVEHQVRHCEQLNTRLMIRFVDQHKGRVKAHTIRLLRHTFHGLCGHLIRRGCMTENPVAGFPIPKGQPYRPHVFSTQELSLFFDSFTMQMEQTADPAVRFRALSWYTFYHLLYACGLRVSEAVALTTSVYSTEQATLFIERSKFLKDRLIPISRKVCANLDRLLSERQQLFGVAHEGLLFLSLPQSRPYNRAWASQFFRRVLQRLGLYHKEECHHGVCSGTPHLHELRRAFAVHRLLKWYRDKEDVNAKLPLLATYMGHSCFGHTKTYLTLTQQLLSEAGRRFAQDFDRLEWVIDDSKLE
jgi:site-specific recombinase XerD